MADSALTFNPDFNPTLLMGSENAPIVPAPNPLNTFRPAVLSGASPSQVPTIPASVTRQQQRSDNLARELDAANQARDTAPQPPSMTTFHMPLRNGDEVTIDAPNYQAALVRMAAIESRNDFRRAEALKKAEEADLVEETARLESLREAYSDQPLFQQFLGGMGKTADDYRLGAADIYRDITPEENRRLSDAEASLSGMGRFGAAAADMALFAAPTIISGGATLIPGIAAKAPKILQAAKGLNQFLRGRQGQQSDLFTAPALEYAKAPNDYISRNERYRQGLMGGGLGYLTGSLAKVPMRGLDYSPEAQRMIGQFSPEALNNLTPGQVSGSAVIRGAENTMSGSGLTAQRVSDMQQRGMEQWSDALRNDTAAGARFSPIARTGVKGMEDTNTALSQAFNGVWDIKYDMLPAQFEGFKTSLTDLVNLADETGLGSGGMQKLNKSTAVIDDQMSRAFNGEQISGRALQDIEEELDDLVTDIYNGNLGSVDADLKEAIKVARDSVEMLLPETTRAELAPLKEAYRRMSILKDASANMTSMEGFTPWGLDAAMRANSKQVTGSSRELAEGRAPFWDETRTAMRAFQKPTPEDQAVQTQGRGMFGLGVGLAAKPFTNTPVQRMLTGTAAPQRMISPYLRNLNIIGVNPTRAGVAIGVNEDL
tara:strand:- start:8623 stop:10590 length:1968 start_codon:yes stop_codon:yes gene_type:complete